MKREPQPDWFKQNWKWFIPVSCVGVIATLAVFVALILAVVFGVIKSSQVYNQAIDKATNHPDVTATMGTPIKPQWFVTGNFEVNGPSGRADITIPLTGPNADARIYANAIKAQGQWTFTSLVVHIEHNQQYINLLAP